MESKQTMPSVIARLMGFEELQAQQPLQKKPRVLSEDYLCRVASIGVREKFIGRHSFRLNIEEQEKGNVVFQLLETLKRSKCNHNSVKKRGAQMNKCIEEEVPTGNKKLPSSKLPNLRESRCHSLLEGNTVLNSLYASDCKDSSRRRKSWRVNEEECTNPLQKFHNGLGAYSSGEHCFDDVNKFFNLQVEPEDVLSCLTSRTVVLKPSLRKAESVARCFPACFNCHETSLLGHGTQNGNLHLDGKGRRNLVNGIGTVRSRSRFSKERARKTGHVISNISRDVPRSEISSSDRFNKKSQLTYHSSSTFSDRKNGFYNLDGPYMAKDAKKQIVERWKTEKKFQKVDLATRSSTLDEMFSVPDDDLRPTNLDYNADNDVLNNQVGPDTGDLNLSTPSGRSSPSFKDGHVRGLLRTRSLLEKFDAVGTKNESKDEDIFEQASVVHMAADMVFDTETEVMTDPYLNHELQQLESKSCILPVKDEDCSSCLPDSLVQQDIFSGNSAEGYALMYCEGMDPESPRSLEEAYQPSPDSVLEEFNKKEILFSSDCFKGVGDSLHDLHMQLERLKSETSEEYSEGSGMVVSSDEDSGDESADSKQNEELLKMFRVEESRHFSYLVDILNEAGFHNKNLHAGILTWNPQECPISYTIFENLEKTYGEQLSWESSERRLLFDRVNSGLVEILEPSMAVPMFTKPVARRISFSQGLQGIEEELWMLLVKQEKEASMESGKVLGKDDGWMELGDNIQAIGREIENSLIDELVEDVVSTESF